MISFDANEAQVRLLLKENERLIAALREIAKFTYGVDPSANDEWRAEYWYKAATTGRDIAREALNPRRVVKSLDGQV